MTAMEMAAASYLSSGSPMAAILVGSSNLLPPLGVLGGAALNVPGEASLRLLGSQGGGVEVHVDLHVLGQLSALVEDAGQVAHGVVPEVPVVVHLLEELIEVILVDIDQAFAGLPLRPPQGLEVREVSAPGQLLEGVVVGAKEGVLDSLAMAGEVKHGLHLHALPLGLLHLRGVHVHILLAPALAPVVVDVDAPQQLGLIGAGASGDVGDGSEEDEGGLHLCAAVQ